MGRGRGREKCNIKNQRANTASVVSFVFTKPSFLVIIILVISGDGFYVEVFPLQWLVHLFSPDAMITFILSTEMIALKTNSLVN